MRRRVGTESDDACAPRAENVCEHGDHPAPPGNRFCSYGCQTCEGNAFGKFNGCDGTCERLNAAEASGRTTSESTVATKEG